MSSENWKEVLCEENGVEVTVERSEFAKDEKDVIEVDIVEDKEEKLRDILKRVTGSYLKERKNKTIEKWLEDILKQELPEKDEEEIKVDMEEIVEGIKIGEESYRNVQKKRALGISPEDILGKEIAKSTVGESVEEAKSELKEISKNLENENISKIYELSGRSGVEIAAGIASFNKLDRYFSNINETIARGNEKMISTITTKAGEISRNPQLDGFIFEQHHENSFNLDLALKDIEGIRGEALVPDGKAYGKNSVDIVVRVKKDGVEKIVQKYQAKASENPDLLYQKGGYKFQRKLYTEGKNDLGKTQIKYGGAESKPISKMEVKELQNKVQSGETESVKQSFKNNVDVKALSKQIGKQAMLYGAVAMVADMGIKTGVKVLNGEKVDIEEITLEGLKVGANVGIATAISAGLKIALEKGKITGFAANLLKKTNVIGTIAFSAVSIVGVCAQIGSGEVSLKDGLKDINSIICATYGGLQGSGIATGLAAGLMVTVGAVLAPVVRVVAGTIGFFVGSTLGTAISKGINSVVSGAVGAVKSVVSAGFEAVKSVASGVYEGVKSVVSGAANLVSSVASSIGSAISSLFGW